jgi:hypothetical protein
MKLFIKTEDKIIFLECSNNNLFKEIKEILIKNNSLNDKGKIFYCGKEGFFYFKRY